MQIDNYSEAIALTEQLDASLPFTVRPGKEFLKVLHQQGERVSPNDELDVTLVKYSGDMGGIMCAVNTKQTGGKVLVTSLTHLKIDPSHPLADAVKAYQQKRIHGLKLQNQRGFMGDMRRLNQAAKDQKKPRT